MSELARVINIGSKIEIDVVEGRKKIRLNNDGTEKRTPNNNSDDRWVDPIRSKDDINNVKKYLQSKVDDTERLDMRLIYARNILMFIVGINSGFRASDLMTIKWNEIFYNDFTFKDFVGRKEGKTKKIRYLYLTDSIQIEINKYLEMKNKDKINLDGYLFETRKNLFEIYYRDSKGEKIIGNLNLSKLEFETAKLIKNKQTYKVRKQHITNKTVDDMMKEVTKKCKIRGDYAARSIRKTYAYQYYLSILKSTNDQELALATVQDDLGHWQGITTAKYLGVHQQNTLEKKNKLDL